MSRPEDEFRLIVIRNTIPLDAERLYGSIRKGSLFITANDDEFGKEFESFTDVDSERGCLHERGRSLGDDFKITVRVLLTGEKKLSYLISNGSDSIREICFNETTKGCIMQLLNFGEAVAIRKISSKKLFRILDMYDVLADALLDFEMMLSDEFVLSEVKGVLAGLGDAFFYFLFFAFNFRCLFLGQLLLICVGKVLLILAMEEWYW